MAFAVTAIVLLTAVNLRGIRESGTAFAIPTYAFMVSMFIMLIWGFIQIFVMGKHLQAESAGFELHSEHGDVMGFALVFLVAVAIAVVPGMAAKIGQMVVHMTVDKGASTSGQQRLFWAMQGVTAFIASIVPCFAARIAAGGPWNGCRCGGGAGFPAMLVPL